MAHLAELHRYPLKSGAALPAEAAAVEARGLRGDRRWMLVDSAGRFLSGRQLPQMTLIVARDDGDGIVLQAPGCSPHAIGVPGADADPRAVTVWKRSMLARDAGDAAADWLGHYLQQPVRLLHLPDLPAADATGAAGPLSFADSAPLLLLSRASLAALNARLPRPVTLQRFRPNLVVDGVDAHAEDGWSRLRIGDLTFERVKPCIRCVFVNVDPQRGLRDEDGEPLRTLAGYRRGDKGVSFGQLLRPLAPGLLRRGDDVVPLT